MKLYLIDDEGDEIFSARVVVNELRLGSDNDYEEQDIGPWMGQRAIVFRNTARQTLGLDATLVTDSKGRTGKFNRELMEANGILLNVSI